MDYAAIILFLAMYYIRPHEWTGLLASLKPVQLATAFSIFSLYSRARGVRSGDFFKTRHDVVIVLYFAWIVLTSPDPVDTFKTWMNLPVFYFVIVLVLTNFSRIERFIVWWMAFIVVVALLAVASTVGFDPLGSETLTAQQKDRLALNLSIFNNPNALGHSVVPVIPMLYFFCFWKRNFFMKQIGLSAMALPIYCIYLTLSKGAMLSGAVTAFVGFTVGRPKWMQIIMVIALLAGGATAVKLMPRMGELNKARTDIAIQGRVKAFIHGHEWFQREWKGIGILQFYDRMARDHKYPKAPHSSYVEIGAEFGKTGFYLFMLLLWTNVRTLFTQVTQNERQERTRRVMIALLFSWVVSSWMVDFALRPTFFMMTACVAAYHRLVNGLTMTRAKEDAEEEKMVVESLAAVTWRRPVPALAMSGAAATGTMPMRLRPQDDHDDDSAGYDPDREESTPELRLAVYARSPLTLTKRTPAQEGRGIVDPSEKPEVDTADEAAEQVARRKSNHFITFWDLVGGAIMFYIFERIWLESIHRFGE